ncbi:protein disulfide isomerase [Plasmodium reichenowi]|uniref:Protein disulfide isomerase n=1 Tax=Plasmodium reichenowi TaxID=5854 RepID=A0A060RS39_PLARE|nr:protein disulfide isomerase [Plasmodium reichenowi]KYN98482.1 protein disulfide isomerase [Plasmodium reichenowi]CDO64253.1 protein disulfide isomerase [Plasmodium reichenowi]
MKHFCFNNILHIFIIYIIFLLHLNNIILGEGAIWEGISKDEIRNVKHLTHEVELQIYSQHTQNCMALFCNEKESKCKNVYKEFVKASNELIDNDVVFVYVDTISLAKTADNFEIKNIPKILTFKDFDPEKGYTFNRKYTKENILEWFKLLPEPSIEIMEKNNVEKYVEMHKKKGYASIIAFCIRGSDNANKFVHFGETQKLPNLAVGLIYVENEEDVKIEIFNGPGSTIPKENLKYKDTYVPYNGIWTSDSIYQFADNYMKQFPIIINYHRKSLPPLNGDIYFYIFNRFGEYSDTLYVELYDLIMKHNQIKFVFPRKDEVLEHFNIENHMSLISIMDYNNASFVTLSQMLRPKKYAKIMDENITVSHVESFLDEFLKNNLAVYRKSEKPIKRREKQKYQILCSNDFESYVMDPEKLVLIFYHVQGCKECKPLFTFWDTVANYFHLENKYKDVLVATMDAKLNDMIDESVDYYPSLALYPKGENKLKRKHILLFPMKLDTLIDVVDEYLEDLDQDL